MTWGVNLESSAAVVVRSVSRSVFWGANEAAPVSHTVTTQPLADTDNLSLGATALVSGGLRAALALSRLLHPCAAKFVLSANGVDSLILAVKEFSLRKIQAGRKTAPPLPPRSPGPA